MSGPRSWPPPGPELDPETPSDAEHVNSPEYWAALDAYDAASMDAQHRDALAENAAREAEAEAPEPEPEPEAATPDPADAITPTEPEAGL